jgi:sugar lactone lactonase YvrE
MQPDGLSGAALEAAPPAEAGAYNARLPRRRGIAKDFFQGRIAVKKYRVTALALAMALGACPLFGQGDAQPTNALPNVYETVKDWAKLPDGRTWGSTSAVEIDKDGKSIWVAERCGVNSCQDSMLDSILHFDENGKLIKSFGSGLLIAPHGITVDRDGNVWVTDCACTGGAPRGGANAAGASPSSPASSQPPQAPPATKGHQVFKFSPDGKLLMTLGKAGGGRDPEFFFQPNDVLIAPNGVIFVSEGHTSTPGATARVLKLSKDGKLIKAWGKLGTAPGEFDQPHALAMDSRGRLFVGDRNNNRIQIFDQDGKFLDQWKQFSRPSGIYIDKNDTIYVADSESDSVARNHNGWTRGIRVGSARDGSVKYLIPDPVEKATGTSAAEGVAADARGNIYGAEVGPRALKRYVKK